MNTMSEEKKLAVLIDSDNVSAKYAPFIMQEVQKYGIPTYKRVYGDWEKGGNGWHFPAINNSLLPVQQCSYIAGKNATDFSMIIDAMDILYSGKVDGFVLVTSDSDFTRLAIRLREAGMLVVGIGELKTPRAFTISCSHFSYLNQVCESEGMADEKTIRKAVLDFVTESNDGRLDLAKINAVLTSKFGNINFDELGYKRFSGFIDSFPELRRSNTFVSLKKRREPKPAVKPANAPTEQEIIASIGEYFSKNEPQNDNMMKIESYLTDIYGKIDFSRFGSKRFARFIDNTSEFQRNGTTITPISPVALNSDNFKAEVIAFVKKKMPEGINPGALNNHLVGRFGKKFLSELGFNDLRAALDTIPEITLGTHNYTITGAENAPDAAASSHETATVAAVTEVVLRYARDNMPDGGNVGQLNNELIGKFGKGYCADINFADFKSLLSSVADVKVRKNFIYLTDAKYAELVDAMREQSLKESVVLNKPQTAVLKEKSINEKQSEQEEKSEENLPEQPKEEAYKETTKPAENAAAEPLEKAEINAVKRDILNFAATNEKGTLSQMGKVLTQKYGKDWLKELGYSSIRRLLSEISGVSVKSNTLKISEDFAAQTEEIEQFVNEFARAEGSHSIRALGIQLKNRFEGFNYADYGFARFTDFINAIDGVKADRYHVSPTN